MNLNSSALHKIEKRRRERGIVDGFGNPSHSQSDTREDEREFPDLRQSNPDAKRSLRPVTKQPYHRKPDRELADENQPQDHREGSPVREQCARIDDHPDRDKEQRNEDIALRKDFCREFVRVATASEEQTSGERAESEGKT